MTVITSAQNARIKHVLGLVERRKMRTRHKQFFVEGVRAITGVCENGWPIETLIYCPQMIHSDWAREIVARVEQRVHLRVDKTLLSRISQRSTPSELIAVVAQAQDDLGRIPLSEKLLAVLVDRPQNPGNLGSLIRSCDALGADGLLVIGHAVDVYAPRTVRASMGSFFALPVVRVDGFETLATWLRSIRARFERFQMIGSSAHAQHVVFDCDLTVPMLLVLGNETRGASYRLRQLCDVNVTIPMSGAASSLNMAAAASILLYEVDRQRAVGEQISLEERRCKNTKKMV